MKPVTRLNPRGPAWISADPHFGHLILTSGIFFTLKTSIGQTYTFMPAFKKFWAIFSASVMVFASYKKEPVLVGYFTLANKYIRISSKFLNKHSSSLRRRISKFAPFDRDLEAYILSAPLIAQLGKNYTNDNKLITGDDLLIEACDRISRIQFDLGGRFAYVECEDKEILKDFYKRNGFCEFDKRTLDPDETEKLDGNYLVQLLKYIRKGK